MTDAAGKRSLGARCREFLTNGYRPHPVGRWEWTIMRVLFAVIVFYDLTDRDPYKHAGQPKPEGIAKFVDLTWLNESWAYPTVLIIVGIACLFYIFGFGLRFALPVMLLLSTMVRTYHNSQGFHDHSHQLIALALLAQTIVVWVFYIRKLRGRPEPSVAMPGWLLYYTQGIIAATYVVAAMSKLMRSTGMWVINSPYISYDLVKAKRQNYYKYLDEDLAGDPAAAVWVLENPNLARLMFGGAFFLELFALLALKNRPWALLIGVALITLHRSIKWMMGLNFATAELLLVIFFINIPFWAWWAANRKSSQLTA